MPRGGTRRAKWIGRQFSTADRNALDLPDSGWTPGGDESQSRCRLWAVRVDGAQTDSELSEDEVQLLEALGYIK